MKRQEAIDCLETIKNLWETRREGNWARIPVDNLDIGALNIAINALQTEPCEDCISRRAAVSVANSFDAPMVARGLEKLPSVHLEPKTGHWITLKDEYGDIVEAVCSKCKKNGNHKWAYCPNCGCQMTGVKE